LIHPDGSAHLRHAGPVPASTVPQEPKPIGARHRGPRNKTGVTIQFGRFRLYFDFQPPPFRRPGRTFTRDLRRFDKRLAAEEAAGKKLGIKGQTMGL
jgi:hypothetical protein